MARIVTSGKSEGAAAHPPDTEQLHRMRGMSSGASPVQATLSRFGSAIGYFVVGQDYQNRLRTATFAREVLERSQVLKLDWNRQVERAAEDGIHVIYTDGFNRLHEELDSLSQNMLLDRGVESEISAVLAQLGKVVLNRNYFDSCCEYMVGQIVDRRPILTPLGPVKSTD